MIYSHRRIRPKGEIMDVDLQEEVVRCPSCNEEVPKTLYCLNCGHPLYKEEDKEDFKDEFEDVIEEKKEVAPEPSVDEVVKIEEKPEQSVTEMTVVSPSEEVSFEEADIAEEASPPPMDEVVAPPEPIEPPQEIEPAEEVEHIQIENPAEEVIIQPEPIETPEAEQVEAEEPAESTPPPEPVVIEEKTESVEVPMEPCAEEQNVCVEDKPLQPEIIVQEDQYNEVVEEKPIQPDIVVQDVRLDEVIEEKEVVVEPVIEMAVEQSKKVEPDPLVREVMENLAKNVSLKVKLAKLFQEGALKESTFNKLFESYSAQGERWMNRRNDLIERNRYDLGTMEKAVADAKVNLEELEIRRAIGDAAEEEYAAKSPAYRWDIESLGDKLEKRHAEIAYLEDLRQVMAEEETEELKTIAEHSNQYIDSLVESGNSSSETVSKVRIALGEALELLKGST